MQILIKFGEVRRGITVLIMDCSQFDTDQSYVNAIQQGGEPLDHAAGCLYRQHREDVLRFVRGYVGSKSSQSEDIRDLVHDAYFILLEKIRFGGYNHGSLLHFWIGITKGLLRNKAKRDSRMDLVEDPLSFEEADKISPEDRLITAENHLILDKLLGRLGERCKRVLMLWAGGYSMREIAEKTDLSSEAMARKTKYKCMKQLIELIETVDVEL